MLMTTKEYEQKMKRIEYENRQLEMKANLEKARKKNKRKFKFPSTSKIVLWAVIFLNVQILWFVEQTIVRTGDTTALYALIAIPATLIPTVWSYYSKSKAENTVGGIVYDSAMQQLHNESHNDGSVG